MSKRETLQLLWEKYINDRTLSATELSQLKELLRDDANREQVAELLQSLYDQNHETASVDYSSQAAFREVWEKLEAENAEASPVIPLSPRRQWWKYAAAAVIVLAMGIWVYQFINRSSPSSQLAGQQQYIDTATIQPGDNKATLMLANGSILALTDADNGVLADQGGTNIVKLASGEIAYESGNNTEGPVLYNTIVTPRGGKYTVTLPDGSKVWMNAGSSLRYPTSFNGDTREVSLTGEAYFEIAHNPSQPFNVLVKDMKVAVLGTHFDIMAYDNEPAIATTLVEGAVHISSPSQEIQLKPGQQALQDSRGQLKVHDDVNIQQVLAWKNGYFQFNDDKLDRLMRQIERWYDVSVEYEGTIPERKFGGKIPRASPLSDVLKVLELSDVKFRVKGKTITVINN
ncbi:MAG: FecR family protein [Sphingobacteriales bacterium]|nr:FecR family protein [Sphingobacteriales bacterium]